MRMLFLGLWLGVSLSVLGAERVFDFQDSPVDKTPAGFRSVVAGGGKPGDWKIVMDEVPPLLAPLTDKAPVVTRRAVLAQLSQDPTDEHFPILIFDGDTFTDFTLSTRFKLVRGGLEQMAGIAFRLQDERNFYVIRASGLGKNLRFYKVVGGQRSNPIGPELEIAKGVWYQLKIQCQGNQIRCWLNGKQMIPTLTDNTFASGKIGFWTKSDSVSYFADTKIVYTPREPLAQVIVRDTMAKNSRLEGLQIYTLNEKGEPRLVASKNEKEVGTAGGPEEKDTITHGSIYYGKEKKVVSVVMPLRDRNGDPIAAVRLKMRSFAGQSEQNALVRARPIVKEMQARVQTLEELTQ
jgi:3-keto-disaccharide hydrolase